MLLRTNATFYCLIRNPEGCDSADFAKRLLTEARVLGIPGAGFGPEGDGYVRLTICASLDLISQAVE